MPAAGAEAVEFQAVGLNSEPVFRGHFLLELLDLTVLELHDLPAAGTDEMIVVPFVRYIVVLGLRTEVSGLGEPCVAE